MTNDISLISSLNSLNLIKQMLNNNTSTSSLNSLLGKGTGTSLLLSGVSATSQLTVNLATLGLVTAAGTLTVGNPHSVFSSTQDTASTIKAVTNFVAAFNKAVTSLSGSSNSISKQNAESLKGLAKANSAALEAIGITIKDGKLVVDSVALEAAAKNKPKNIQVAFNDTTFVTTVAAKAKSAIGQVLGLTSSAGFLSMYTSSLSSRMSSMQSSLINGYL